MNLNEISTSGTSFLPSSDVNRLPESGVITVVKSIRLTDQLCMGGYTYQIKNIGKHTIRWTCKENRVKKLPCRTAIFTTKNSGTEQNPSYSYLNSNSIPHNHHSDEDSQVILTFKSKLKEIGQINRSAPPTKLYNTLATQMKLSDKQMGMLTRSEILSECLHCLYLTT